jgi:RNA polymerase sigma-70 factor (ECF subfamily)
MRANITLESFESIFKLNHQRLCSLAYNLVRDNDAAKDIVQDVFYKVWKNRGKIDSEDHIDGYLTRATSRTAFNYIRNNARLIKFDKASIHINSLRAASGAEEIGFTELELRVREAIDKLPARCKAIYILSRHEGLKYPEIAEMLGLSVKTVENQMSIALQKLRDYLRPFITPEFIIILLLVIWLLVRLF